MKTIATVSLLLIAGVVHAEVYRCVEKGKVTYTDTACSYSAAPLKIDPKANSYAGGNTYDQSSNYRASSANRKCNDLLEEMSRTVPDPSRQSIGEVQATKLQHKSLREQYELQCMSSEERGAASQERMESQMNDMQRRQRRMDIRQQEMQNRQRGYGY